jgi:hypothetical protein
MMKKIFLFLTFLLSNLSANTSECEALYLHADEQWKRLQPILKTNVASQVGWDLIHKYIDAASLTLSECEPDMKLDFRYLRELKLGIAQADKKRSQFKVQTYRQMVNQARREGKCTIIYRSYGK